MEIIFALPLELAGFSDSTLINIPIILRFLHGCRNLAT